jgi:hypothetical protein
MKSILFLKTNPTIYENTKQALYHQNGNINITQVASVDYPVERNDLYNVVEVWTTEDELQTGEEMHVKERYIELTPTGIALGNEINTIIYKITSNIYTEEEIYNRFKKFGTVLTLSEATALSSVIQPNLQIKLNEEEKIQIRDMFYMSIETMRSREALIKTMLMDLSGYNNNNIVIDPIRNLNNVETSLSTNYYFNKWDGEYIIEAVSESENMTLITKGWDIQVSKITIAGVGTGAPYMVWASNDDGATWHSNEQNNGLIMNANGLTSEIIFPEGTPTKLRLKLIAVKGLLPFKPYLTCCGFVWA